MAGAMALTSARSVAPEFSHGMATRAQRLVVRLGTDTKLAVKEAVR